MLHFGVAGAMHAIIIIIGVIFATHLSTSKDDHHVLCSCRCCRIRKGGSQRSVIRWLPLLPRPLKQVTMVSARMSGHSCQAWDWSHKTLSGEPQHMAILSWVESEGWMMVELVGRFRSEVAPLGAEADGTWNVGAPADIL